MSEKIVIVDDYSPSPINFDPIFKAFKRNLKWIVLITMLFSLIGYIIVKFEKSDYIFRSSYYTNLFKTEEIEPVFLAFESTLDNRNFRHLKDLYGLTEESVKNIQTIDFDFVQDDIKNNTYFTITVTTNQDSTGALIIDHLLDYTFTLPYFEEKYSVERTKLIDTKAKLDSFLVHSEGKNKTFDLPKKAGNTDLMVIPSSEYVSALKEITTIEAMLKSLNKFSRITAPSEHGLRVPKSKLMHIFAFGLIGFFLSCCAVIFISLFKEPH